jgi:hypothetical protein
MGDRHRQQEVYLEQLRQLIPGAKNQTASKVTSSLWDQCYEFVCKYFCGKIGDSGTIPTCATMYVHIKVCRKYYHNIGFHENRQFL